MKSTSILAALVATTLASSAATIIDSTVLTPEQQANFSVSTVGALNTGGAWTFTTGVLGTENQLVSIGLEGRNTGVGDQPVQLELWSDTDNDSQTLGGTLIGTSTIVPTGLPLGNVVTIFTFTGITLSDNTVYAVHFLSNSSDANDRGFGLVGSTTTDLLSGSRLFQDGALVFGGTGTNGIDASFNVTTVPEPSIALLGGLGVLGLLRRRRA